MTREAKQELAKAYNGTVHLHEASYNNTSDTYLLTWRQAAEHACEDQDLVLIVYCMAVSGYSDFTDWAQQHD
jgi:hypothetical protein